MTARMLAAVESPHTDILGHCTGRLITGTGAAARPPSTPRPSSPPAAARARRWRSTRVPSARIRPRSSCVWPSTWGCLVSIDSDAHAPGQLEWLGRGCANAVRAEVPEDRVVNRGSAGRAAGLDGHPRRLRPPDPRYDRAVTLPLNRPVSPMLAKLTRELPRAEGMFYEPKWDGFRCIVFRDGDEVELGSRNEKPLTRYFPELIEPLPARSARPVRARRRDRDRRPLGPGLRCPLAEDPPGRVPDHPPGGDDAGLLRRLRHPRRRRSRPLRRPLRPAPSPARGGAHLGRPAGAPDPGDHRSRRGRRLVLPVRRGRDSTAWWPSPAICATCPTSGPCSRSSTNGPPTAWWPASAGTRRAASSDRSCSACTTRTECCTTSAWPRGSRAARRRELVARARAVAGRGRRGPPLAGVGAPGPSRLPGGTSRWSAGKDMSWEPLRPELVCEVGYDHLQEQRFRHGTSFRRWRPDRQPSSCTYAQLDTPVPFELAKVFGTR